MDLSPTIVAIASPPGRSLRGTVRISGACAFDLLRAVICDELSEPLARGVQRLRFRMGDRLTLPVLAMHMPSPHSYTGEDSVELQLPGNPILLDRVLQILLDCAKSQAIDARLAHPGEFTARAFFCGRLTLTQAEGVAATIAARSDAELRAATMLRTGGLGAIATQWADELTSALALVEAGIDFTDQEDVIAISPADLHERLTTLRAEIDAKLRRSVGMEQLEAIPWVVLRGKPNAGKSTLFNALLGRERAVVSDIAGTTRDVIAEPLHLQTGGGDAEVMLIDLAGRDEDDPSPINRLMQEAARSAIGRAELILQCVSVDDADEPDALDENTIVVRTKADLSRGGETASEDVRISAVSGEGLDSLRDVIAARLADRAVSLAGDALALGARHESALRSALDHLDEAIALVEPIRAQGSLAEAEIIAAAMRAGLDDLGALAGDVTPDDVLGRIFASFCIGK